MFWGAKGWNLRRDQRDFLNKTQNEIGRKVLGMRPAPGEAMEDYMKRLYNRLASLRRALKIEPWADRWARLHYAWAGRTQEGGATGGERNLVTQALQWRGWDWLRQREAKHQGRQAHGFKCRPWRWEADLAKFAAQGLLGAGPRWQDAMRDRNEWMRGADAFVEWRRSVHL